jgi:hypothetical protein
MYPQLILGFTTIIGLLIFVGQNVSEQEKTRSIGDLSLLAAALACILFFSMVVFGV